MGIIPARYASSRFEGKPLVQILGKPMIQVGITSLLVIELNTFILWSNFPFVHGFFMILEHFPRELVLYDFLCLKLKIGFFLFGLYK